MKNPEKNTKKYIQTDIFSFCNEIKNEQMSLLRKNSIQNNEISQLKKVAQYRQIKKEVIKFDEWQRILGNDWKPFENNKYFISNDHSMVVGNLSDYDNLMKTKKISNNFQFLKEINNLYEISNLKIKTGNFETITFNKFLYTYDTLEKSYNVLEKPILIYQNEHGLVVCKNYNVFMLIAPILI